MPIHKEENGIKKDLHYEMMYNTRSQISESFRILRNTNRGEISKSIIYTMLDNIQNAVQNDILDIHNDYKKE